MLKMRTTQTFELLGVVFILVAVLAIAAYLQLASAPTTPSIPAEEAVGQVAAPAISVNPAAGPSVYVGNQSLRRMLDDAYEKHQTARVQLLLGILNGRYERRSGKPW